MPRRAAQAKRGARPRRKKPTPSGRAAQAEQALKKLGAEVRHWVNKGRYTRVRITLRGKPVLPDIPVAYFAAAEGLAFAVSGPLRAILVNLVGKTVLDVELLSDALHHVARGRERVLAGELEQAIEQYRQALAMDRDCAAAHLHLGVALKLHGDWQGARSSLERARTLDPKGPSGLEAGKLLAALRERRVEKSRR